MSNAWDDAIDDLTSGWHLGLQELMSEDVTEPPMEATATEAEVVRREVPLRVSTSL